MTKEKKLNSGEDKNDDSVTEAGDLIHYDVLVTNTVAGTWPEANANGDRTAAVCASDLTLAVGGSLDFTPSYTLTQADVDNKGNPAGTGNVKNTATVVSNQDRKSVV